MAFAGSEKEWAERVARHLKAELKRAGLTYEELALRLKELGFDETKATITTVVTVCELKIFRSVNGMPRKTVLPVMARALERETIRARLRHVRMLPEWV
jgi:hypothetical protein